MRMFVLASVLALIAVTPFSASSNAQGSSTQGCTGPECATPGGHQCERTRKEAPTA
jgi:hypothetical protein